MEAVMTFKEWIEETPMENPAGNEPWGLLHISILLICIAACVGTYFLRKHPIKLRVNIIRGLAIGLLFFEIARRVIQIYRETTLDNSTEQLVENIFYWLIPRPWCAISVWLVIVSAIVNKRVLYNITAMNAIICVIIYFAYPSAGFGNLYLTFEDVYSISTHMLLFISGISMITMGLTEFRYVRTGWKDSAIWELIGIIGVFAYAFLQIFVLKLQPNADPLYFVPTNGLGYVGYENEVQVILGMSNGVYVFVYVLFMAVYFNLFFIIQYLVDKKRAKKAVVAPIDTVEETV